MIQILFLLHSQVINILPGDHDFSQFVPIARNTYIFKKGIHRFKNSITITANKVNFRAEPGAKLLGSIGVKPSLLKNEELRARLQPIAKSKVKVLSLPPNEALGRFENRGFAIPVKPSQSEVIADGIAMRPARYPNIDGEKNGWTLTGAPNGRFRFQFPTERVANWKNDGNIWTYGYWQYDWADAFARVKEINSQIQLEESTSGAVASYGVQKGRRFFFCNVLEELDQPGEYWIDFQKNQVLAWLPESTKNIEISTLEKPFFKIQNAEGVRLVNLDLQSSRGNGIEVENSKEVELSHLTLKNLGGTGIRISGGEKCAVSDSRISELGASGVTLSGGNREKLIPAEHRVENCEISLIGRYYRTYNPAVSLEGVGQIVRRCTLENLPHQAIYFRGNNHLIELCEIRKTDLETSDSSAIYVGRSFVDRGTVIRYNRFTEIEPRTHTEGNFGELVMAVYLDDNQAGISTIGNIFDIRGFGVFIGGGQDNIVKGNIFLNNVHAVHIDDRANGWAKENFRTKWGYQEAIKASPWNSPIWRQQFPNLASALDMKEDISKPRRVEISGNICVGSWLRLYDGLKPTDFEMKENTVIKDEKPSMTELLKLLKEKGTVIPIEKIGARIK